MDNKKLDKQKIEQFVSMGMTKLLAATYLKAVGSVTVLELTHINEKNGKLTYTPVAEEKIPEALLYLQEKGNHFIGAVAPKTHNIESGEDPKYIAFVQQDPDIRAIETLLAHAIGRPTESIKVEQETKVLHIIAEEAMKRKQEVPDNLSTGTPITSPFSPWRATNN